MDSPSERLLALGERWKRSGHWTEASTLYEAAQETATALGDADTRLRAANRLHQIAWLNGALDEALSLLASTHPPSSSSRLAIEAFLTCEQGDLVRASRLLDALLTTDASVADRAVAVGYRAHISRATGDWDAAHAGYANAIDALGADALMAAVFQMDSGITKLVAGRPGEALNQLGRARAMAKPYGSDVVLERLLHHYEMLCLFALGEQAALRRRLTDGDGSSPPQTLAFLRDARRALVAPADLRELADRAPPSEHARLSLRVLHRFLEPRPHRPTLRVHLGDLRLEVGSIEMSLKKRPTLWRIAAALLRARETAPGQAVPDATLLEAGWPGERMLPRAAKNRLHVAIASLRKLGLRGALVRRGGYLLDPRLPLVWVDGSVGDTGAIGS